MPGRSEGTSALYTCTAHEKTWTEHLQSIGDLQNAFEVWLRACGGAGRRVSTATGGVWRWRDNETDEVWQAEEQWVIATVLYPCWAHLRAR